MKFHEANHKVPHAVPMQFPCGSHAVPMRFPCGSHAVPMWFPCGSHAVPMQFPCGSHAVPIQVPSLSHLPLKTIVCNGLETIGKQTILTARSISHHIRKDTNNNPQNVLFRRILLWNDKNHGQLYHIGCMANQI